MVNVVKNYKDFFKLLKLYFAFLFQKVTIIILTLSFLLMITILVLIATSNYEYIYYLKNYQEIHDSYISQAILIVMLFNTIIASSMVISLYVNSISFDQLFISQIKRRTLSLSKASVLFIVLFLIVILELFIAYLIPILRFPYFKISAEIFVLPFIFILPLLLEVIVLMVITVFIPNVFLTMTVSFLSIAHKVISMNFSEINSIAKYIIPSVSTNGNLISIDAIYMIPIWGILFLVLYFKIYEIKDLK